MLPNDPGGTHLRRLGEGDVVIEPGGGDHPGPLPLPVPHCAGDHVPHAVDELAPAGHALLKGHVHRLRRDEPGLGGHDAAARPALWKFVHQPFLLVFVLHVGQQQQLRKALDEGGFARAHGAGHGDIDIAPGPLRHIPINISHTVPPLSSYGSLYAISAAVCGTLFLSLGENIGHGQNPFHPIYC